MTGQDLFKAGYELAKGLAPQYPDGDVHVLIGLSAPGQSWAEARAGGVKLYMEEYKAARIFRDSRIGTIGGGTSEIMREIIAKTVINNN